MRPADLPAAEMSSTSLPAGHRDDDSKLEQCAEPLADIAVTPAADCSLPISFGDLDPVGPLFADDAAADPAQVPDIAQSAILPPSVPSATSPEPEPSISAGVLHP
ncbi:hypothetical protein QAD02_023250 [Eretmocerus hayati]|uniref:Uncharacterized protein n=1 Tax=Eretmocerus hayati TaxID=131215 RepID=A0ACC2PVA1_9HYME|nr:hypothetical protein QAD02_023250 [Eretmocerus hayati]